jgi:hypothetical protein
MHFVSSKPFYACLRAALFLLFFCAVASAQSIRVPTYPGSTLHKVKGTESTAAPNPWFPTISMDDDAAQVQQFFGSNQSISPLSQIGSSYNGASSSATVSANLVSLIFKQGWQAVVATNIQAGSSGVTDVARGTVPTLSASAAGQATQNMLYGGTLAFVADLPLIYYGPHVNESGGWGFELDGVSREGIDIQNFKSGTTTNVTSPPSHHATQLESYLLYNSANPSSGSTTGFAGSLFVGGSYGYSYTSHQYARDYGFGNRVNNDLGQVSAGILITNVAKISVSRAFGPSQTYIDSTSMIQTKVNNFKAWSFGITYQQAAPAPKNP